MLRDPRGADETVLDLPTVFLILWIGAALSLVGLALFFAELARSAEPVGARTMLFTFIVTAEMGVLFVIRRRSGLTPLSNPWLLGAVALSLVMQLVVLYSPLAQPFGVRGLSLAEWTRIAVANAGFVMLALLGSRLTPDSSRL
jgi:Ca2+-transporting ATPase